MIVIMLMRMITEYRQSVIMRSKDKNGFKERYLFRTKHNMHIFGVIAFKKLQNDTWTTVKRWKTKKNDTESWTTFEPFMPLDLVLEC